MKKIIINFFLLTIIVMVVLLVVLSTIGIETSKFNKLISEKASQTKNINLELETIKFKLNPKELSLFLETQNPKITYREIFVPVRNIKVFIDFLSLIKSDPKIKKTSLTLKELDITQLNKLSLMIKPSNFKSLLNNKVKEGKVIAEIDLFLTEEGKLKDFIAKGTVKNLKVDLLNDLSFTKINLGFFADKNDILIKNIFGNLEDIKIFEGDVKLNLENGIKLKSNFNSKFNLDQKLLNKYVKFLNKYKFINNIKNVKADLNNIVSIDFDNTYKIEDYNYSISGILEKGKFELLTPLKNTLIPEEIESIYLSDLKVSTNFQPKKINLKGVGKYSFDNLEFLKINLENNFNKDLTKLKLNFDYSNIFELNFLNYKKTKNTIANLSLNLEKKKNEIKIQNFNFKDDDNVIKVTDLVFNGNQFSSFKKIAVMTTNNDFFIQNDKKILIKGNKFDATNLTKLLSKNNGENIFKEINGNIEIDFKNIQVPLSEKLQNFKLLGEIKNGQFIKISSKGDFGGNNFLDVSMKKDKKSDKKYL